MDVEKGPTMLSNRRQQNSLTQYFLGQVLSQEHSGQNSEQIEPHFQNIFIHTSFSALPVVRKWQYDLPTAEKRANSHKKFKLKKLFF